MVVPKPSEPAKMPIRITTVTTVAIRSTVLMRTPIRIMPVITAAPKLLAPVKTQTRTTIATMAATRSTANTLTATRTISVITAVR